MNKKISVIVPIYNVEDYLKRCIDSIINQSYSNIEILLVNDGSTDKSLDICYEYASIDSRIKVINKKNGGLSSARNAGICEAVGEYLSFIDSDDFIEKDFLEKMLYRIISNNCEISICNFIYDFDDGTTKVRYKNDKKNYVMDSEEAILQLNNYKYFDMSACSKMYKREIFDDIKFPEGKFCEDYYVMYLLFDKANRICYFNEPLYHYYQRKGSITKDKKLKYDFIFAAYEQMNFVEKKYPNLINVVKSAYVSANMTVYNMALKNDIALSQEDKNKFQIEVKSNYKYIKENKNIPRIKKIQTFMFKENLVIYDIFFKIYKLFYKI